MSFFKPFLFCNKSRLICEICVEFLVALTKLILQSSTSNTTVNNEHDSADHYSAASQCERDAECADSAYDDFAATNCEAHRWFPTSTAAGAAVTRAEGFASNTDHSRAHNVGGKTQCVYSLLTLESCASSITWSDFAGLVFFWFCIHKTVRLISWT